MLEYLSVIENLLGGEAGLAIETSRRRQKAGEEVMLEEVVVRVNCGKGSLSSQPPRTASAITRPLMQRSCLESSDMTSNIFP